MESTRKQKRGDVNPGSTEAKNRKNCWQQPAGTIAVSTGPASRARGQQHDRPRRSAEQPTHEKLGAGARDPDRKVLSPLRQGRQAPKKGINLRRDTSVQQHKERAAAARRTRRETLTNNSKRECGECSARARGRPTSNAQPGVQTLSLRVQVDHKADRNRVQGNLKNKRTHRKKNARNIPRPTLLYAVACSSSLSSTDASPADNCGCSAIAAACVLISARAASQADVPSAAPMTMGCRAASVISAIRVPDAARIPSAE